MSGVTVVERPSFTVAIVDDHVLVRECLEIVCCEHPDVRVVYCGDSLTELARIHPAPRLVLLDLDLGSVKVGEDDARAILERGSAVIAVSAMAVPESVRALLRVGITGFVSKNETSRTLRKAIDSTMRGESWTSPNLAALLARLPERPQLSEQELTALTLYASGLKLSSVARQMGVKTSTAKEYIERVREKYAAVGRPAPTKIHLRSAAQQDGLMESEG